MSVQPSCKPSDSEADSLAGSYNSDDSRVASVDFTTG